MSVWLWIPFSWCAVGVVLVGFAEISKPRPGEPSYKQAQRIAVSVAFNLGMAFCILKGGGVL